MRRSLTYTLTPLIRGALEHPDRLTVGQATDLGQASRALFLAAWDVDPRDQRIIGAAIAAVVRTFATAPDESEQLLRRVIQPNRLREYGHEEVPALAREIARLFVVAPDLCADVYDAAFSYSEESDAPTVMLGGVMSLTSNRRQDYDMARYELANEYAVFLRESPQAAMRALVAAGNAYASSRSGGFLPEDTPKGVLGPTGSTVVFRPDASGVWDEGTFAQESEVRMLGSFEERLDTLAAEDPSRALELIGFVLDLEAPAAIWRRMFVAAARRPDVFADALAPLAGAAVVLQSSDLLGPAVDCCAASFPNLNEDARAAIEHAILGLAQPEPGHEERGAERRRDYVLGRLPEEALVTPEARKHYTALKDEGRAPVEPPPPFDDGWRTSTYDERAYLVDEGVDVDAEPTRRLHGTAEPVKAFAAAYLNDIPTADAARELAPALRTLLEAIGEPGAHQLQTDAAWGHLAAAARAISRQSALACDDEVSLIAERILLAASEHGEPRPRDGDPANFDETPSWGSPAPRVDAADGLVHMASRPECDREALLAAIDRLRADPATVVRYRIAQTIAMLSNSELETMWAIVDVLATDVSTAVREALVGSLHLLLRVDRARSLEAVRAIYGAIEDAPGAVRLRHRCLEVACDVYVWDGDESAQLILDELIDNLPSDDEQAGRVVFRLREATRVGSVEPPDPRCDAARVRALGFIERLLVAANDVRRDAGVGQPQRMDEWSEDAVSRWQAAMRLIDNIATELFFSSGAYDARHGQEGTRSPNDAEMRFYPDACGIIDALVDIGVPRVAHHMLETLEHFVELDPRGVFLRIVTTIKAGQPYGYQYDNLAEPVFVRIVERYLAEHRTMLQQDLECSRALVEILDIFVRAGWPSARRLTHALSDIYR